VKHRSSFCPAVAVALSFVLLAPAVPQAQKSKTPPLISVAVTLDAGNSSIRPEGDPNLPYAGTLSPTLRAGTTSTYDYYFTFALRYDTTGLDAKRSVVFDFGGARYSAGATVACYPTEDYPVDRAKVPYMFKVPTFLTTTGITEGSQKPSWVTVQTSYEWFKNAAGTWYSTGTMLDARATRS
jgi:hypothetical protein